MQDDAPKKIKYKNIIFENFFMKVLKKTSSNNKIKLFIFYFVEYIKTFREPRIFISKNI